MGITCIKDGPDEYPQSCVRYVWFPSPDLRLLFARCRAREAILLDDLGRATIAAERALLEARLQEVRAVLCFFAANCKGED